MEDLPVESQLYFCRFGCASVDSFSLHAVVSSPGFQVWLKVAHFIGQVNTQVILTLLYYLVFTPYGLVMRLFGGDPLQRKLKSAETYWESLEFKGLKDRTRYEKQF